MLAKDNDFDVVLIDTAGRMQDNEVRFGCEFIWTDANYVLLKPLMRALAKVLFSTLYEYELEL